MGKSEIDEILSGYDQLEFNISGRYRFLWLVGGLLITVLVVSIVVYCLTDKEPELKLSQIIPIVSPIIAGGAVITTLIYHTFNYHLNHQLNGLKIKQDRRAVAIALIGEFQKKEMIEAAIFSTIYFKSNSEMNVKELTRNIQSDEKLRFHVTMLLNFYERVSLATDLGVADEKILRDFFKGIFKRQHNMYNDYIINIRRDREDGEIFERFEKTANRWNKSQ